MKSSGLFPLMVLLALGILAPWTVEGGKNGELELLWANTDGLGVCSPSAGCFSDYSGPQGDNRVSLGSEVSVRLQGV